MSTSEERPAPEPALHRNPNSLWAKQLSKKSLPRSEIPDKIGDMVITEELLADYAGHELFLKERAKHPPHCYSAYDSLRLCLVQRLDPPTCGRVMEAYRPCAAELHKARIARMMAAEEERRKVLAAKARVLESAVSAAAGSSK